MRVKDFCILQSELFKFTSCTLTDASIGYVFPVFHGIMINLHDDEFDSEGGWLLW